MIDFIKSNLIKNKIPVFIFIFCLTFFYYILLYVRTDIQLHIEQFEILLAQGKFPIPPLYYFTIYVLSYIVGNLRIASVILLSIAVVAKYLTALKIGSDYKVKKSYLAYIILATMIAIPILTKKSVLVGKISMNVWHNSTVIFLMPFAILLFIYSYKIIEAKKIDKRNGLILFVLILLNVLIKPSFLFVFIPIFPLLFFINTKDWKQSLVALSFSVYGFFCIIMEYVYIYITNPNKEGDGVGFGFAKVWIFHSGDYLIIDLLSSIALPLVVCILFFERIKKDKRFIYAISLFIFSVLIYLVIHETGERTYHGNFAWQAIVCNYILFLLSTLIGFEYVKEKGWKQRKSIWFLVFFSLHTFSGFLYFFKFLIKQTY